MQQSDFHRFRELMAGMAKVFEREIDELLLDAYWFALRPWTLPEFERAAAHLMRTSEFMPRPAAFERLRKAAKPTAAEAWSQVLEHCKGRYRDGAGIDDGGPIDTAVAGLGGYRAIAHHALDYLPILQRQFVARYDEQTDVTESRARVPEIAAPAGAALRLVNGSGDTR